MTTCRGWIDEIVCILLRMPYGIQTHGLATHVCTYIEPAASQAGGWRTAVVFYYLPREMAREQRRPACLSRRPWHALFWERDESCPARKRGSKATPGSSEGTAPSKTCFSMLFIFVRRNAVDTVQKACRRQAGSAWRGGKGPNRLLRMQAISLSSPSSWLLSLLTSPPPPRPRPAWLAAWPHAAPASARGQPWSWRAWHPSPP